MAKLILSRKGFDSSAGGYPSPILGKELVSFPIPQASSLCRYDEVWSRSGIPYDQIMKDLGIEIPSGCHLDPDLQARSLRERPQNWLPVFGQHGAALSHLEGEGVGEGDLFLFFGWFRFAEKANGKWCYVPKAPDLHVIYGYLEIDRVVDLQVEAPPSWLAYHPHVYLSASYLRGGNKLFIAKDRSSFWEGAPGGGTFQFGAPLILTDQRKIPIRRSSWILPTCFFDQDWQCLLSYHRHKTGQPRQAGYGGIKAAYRGQEFVMELGEDHFLWLEQMKPAK